MEVIVKKLSDIEKSELGISEWSIWTKEISKFDWFYDSQEMCLFLEGKAVIETDRGMTEINVGDFVVFPKGLSCVWNVIEPEKKHYKFD